MGQDRDPSTRVALVLTLFLEVFSEEHGTLRDRLEFTASTKREPDSNMNWDLELPLVVHLLLLHKCSWLRQRDPLLLIWVLPMSMDHYAWATEARVGAGTACLPLSAKEMLWGLGVTLSSTSDHPFASILGERVSGGSKGLWIGWSPQASLPSYLLGLKTLLLVSSYHLAISPDVEVSLTLARWG